MPGPLVRSSILNGAAEHIRSLGGRPGVVAREAGLPMAALADGELLISGRAVVRFFAAAARECDRRSWGIELAAGQQLAAIIGPLWVMLRHARTVREMCQTLADNYDIYTSAAVMNFVETRRGAFLEWSVAAGVAEDEVQIAEFAIAVLLAPVRAQAPPRWTPPAVRFRHRAPTRLRQHRACFGPGLRFSCERNGFEIDKRVLDRSLEGRGDRSPGARQFLGQWVRLQEQALAPPIAGQVEAVLRALMPYTPCALEDVGQAMGLSARQLQARLLASGSSFRAIKDAVRQDLAHKYLQHSELSATQVASLLGYTDPTSFSRAYRRWTQSSLRQDRRV